MKAEPVPGIEATPDESNARYFHVVVVGPRDVRHVLLVFVFLIEIIFSDVLTSPVYLTKIILLFSIFFVHLFRVFRKILSSQYRRLYIPIQEDLRCSMWKFITFEPVRVRPN